MIIWKRFCQSPVCPDGKKLAAIPGAEGLLAEDLCNLNLNDECQSRLRRPMDPIGRLWSKPVIGAYRLGELQAKPANNLIDILDNVSATDFWIIHKWALDYTRRRIPWAVVRRGERFALLKEKRRKPGDA